MEWFRWFVGSATDPKFLVVARRSGQNVAAVVAVWAMLLERACASDERGSIVGFDREGADVALGLPDGAAQAIVEAMREKGLHDGERITAWSRRQPKREDSSRERMRAMREKRKVTRCDAGNDGVTRCDARGEERRLDESEDKKTPLRGVVGGVTADASPSGPPPCPAEKIRELYNAVLSDAGLPEAKVLGKALQGQIRARWREDRERRDLAWWRRYFEHVRRCDWLMGRVDGRGGQPFRASLNWLTGAENMGKVLNGQYDPRGGGASALDEWAKGDAA